MNMHTHLLFQLLGNGYGFYDVDDDGNHQIGTHSAKLIILPSKHRKTRKIWTTHLPYLPLLSQNSLPELTDVLMPMMMKELKMVLVLVMEMEIQMMKLA
jgi:hypothetical protein